MGDKIRKPRGPREDRWKLAQRFKDASGNRILIAANHLKTGKYRATVKMRTAEAEKGSKPVVVKRQLLGTEQEAREAFQTYSDDAVSNNWVISVAKVKGSGTKRGFVDNPMPVAATIEGQAAV